MSKIKKILCMLLVFTMITAPCSLFNTAVAQTADNEPLKIEVSTDKSSYTAYGIAEITVKVTNVSDETIKNISAEAVFEQLAPVGKNNETSKEIDSLKSGESFSFSYNATVNASKVKINFFEKIILWFVRLFNGGYNAIENNFDDGRALIENNSYVKFGNYTLNNIVKVWYTLEGFTEQELNYMSTVDETLKDLKSTANFESLEYDDRKIQIENQLEELENQGMINSIFYDSKTKSFIFMYSSGISGGVSLEPYEEKPANALSEASLDYKRSNSYITSVSTTNKAKQDDKQIFISYGWDNYTDSDSMYSLFQKYNDEFKSKGLSTYLSPNTTVEEYKTVLLDKKIVCIMEHGKSIAVFNIWELSNTTVYTFVTRETPTKQTDSLYYSDLKAERIYKRDNTYCIAPDFFSYYYSDNKLENSIVFIGSCMGFGEGKVVDYNFSHELCEKCGVDTVIGFHNNTRIGYSSTMMFIFILDFIKGMTVSESIKNAQEQLGYTDCEWIRNNYSDTEMNNIIEDNGKTLKENVEYDEYYKLEGTPIVAGVGGIKWETDYGNAIASGVVKDKETNEAISGVTVEVVDNESDSLDPIATVTTNENGVFSVELPYGSYSFSFHHDDYEYYGTSQTVGVDYVSFGEILLYSKESSSGGNGSTGEEDEERTVTDSGTCGDNLTWTLYDDGELVISGVGDMPNWTYSSRRAPWDSYRADITSVNIGNNVTSIGNYAFSYCNSLTDVTIPGSVTTIGDEAFYYCDSLTNITIPDSVTTIGAWTFGNCHSLTRVIIPDSVTTIGAWVFSYCKSLINVTIPNSVTTIGAWAFEACHSLTSIVVDRDNKHYTSDNCGVLFNKSKTNLIQYPVGNTRTDYTIPDSVTTINAKSFENCHSLTSITIPDSVTTINDSTFCNCDGLTSVKISNSVITIAYDAFFDCDNLTSITIPNSVTTIGIGAFGSCNSLANVTIGKSVTIIGYRAFSDCDSLTNIIIPDSVTTIAEDAFWGCNNLTSVLIGNSVTSIGDKAFQCCGKLTSVSIAKSVTTIEDEAFDRCENLTNIYYCGTKEEWNNISIGSSNYYLINATIHYNS